eukprot:327724-Prorocentrum_minimum.AAC.1
MPTLPAGSMAAAAAPSLALGITAATAAASSAASAALPAGSVALVARAPRIIMPRLQAARRPRTRHGGKLGSPL